MDARASLLPDASPTSRLFPGLERPLFGNDETAVRSRIIYLLAISIPAVISAFTVISAFVFVDPGGGGGAGSGDEGGAVCRATSPQAFNIILAMLIGLITCSHITVMYWYRQGGLDPGFLTLSYCNAVCIVALGVCANLYIHVPSSVVCH